MQDSVDKITDSVRNSQMVRLAFVTFLVLLLQIPILMIGQLVTERRARRDSAVAEVSEKWGGTQSLTGPALLVPYTEKRTEVFPDGRELTMTDRRVAVFLADQLHIKGTLDSDVRKRGIFSVPVYKLDVMIDGEFGKPDFRALGINPESIDWSNAHLAVGISDTRAIQRESSVTWNGRTVPFLPGTKDFSDGGAGIHAVTGFDETTDRIKFSFPLQLNGSIAVDVVPFAQNTVVELVGDHGHPSFQGNWLPGERTLSKDSFSAKWTIPFLGRGYAQSWRVEAPVTGTLSDIRKAINSSRFGVQLVNPIDHYRMASRSVKYAALFVLLTFAAVWLIEILAGVRVHSIQYLMLGAALCLFYLLELSMSEHLGFPVAYSIASTAVVALVGGYGRVMLNGVGRALLVSSGVAALYAYLYLLLVNEDYALLTGSIGLFVMLSAIMYATRRVDWHSVGREHVKATSTA